ncbi:hypothetical protein B296_00048519 [Ensete ventricosum]|uniref:Uncharacterized protein n=1 Tax=Ensete ventricosum TaxID=4639 RepID=A0A426YJ34_ENSVE|nr:hypothetical protein B296_00048519 [Ensete ventricosum]
MVVVLNFSQSWALYCLVLFYTATKDELAHIKPLAKFLMFKSIVFLTWWQDVAIALLYSWGLFKSPIAQTLQSKSSVQDFIICIEMCVAAIIHLYVFPAKPYKLLGDRFPGCVSVLGDYATLDCSLDPDEVRDSERPTKLRFPQPDVDTKTTAIKESVCDVVLGGGEYVSFSLALTTTSFNQAVEPMEKGFTLFNRKLHKISENIRKHEKKKLKTKDDRSTGSASPSPRVFHGIDDPLLYGSISDGGAKRGRRHRQESGYTSAESGGDSSDHGHEEEEPTKAMFRQMDSSTAKDAHRTRDCRSKPALGCGIGVPAADRPPPNYISMQIDQVGW